MLINEIETKLELKIYSAFTIFTKRQIPFGGFMAIDWPEELMVGNALIDEQHKMIINAASEVVDTSSQLKGADEVGKSVDSLISCIAKHFADEEDLQVKYEYPEFETHKKIHDAYKKAVAKLSEKIKLGENAADVALDITFHVVNWFANHIKTQDIKIVEHVKSKTA